jgi:cyclohexadieny/prephenate dehydrogenase
VARVVVALHGELAPGAVITDIASVKAPVAAAAAAALPPRHRFVPGHPVAGTEHSGPAASIPGLFEDRWCLLTPLAGGGPEDVAVVRRLWQAVGARVAEVDAAEHDRMMAAVSHLPHAVAFALLRAVADFCPEARRYAAGGLRDFTRVAKSDPALWADILRQNRAALAGAVAAAHLALDDLMAAATAGEDALARWLRTAAEAAP